MKSDFELAFVTHLEANMPEQDAYIERQPGSGLIYRVTQGDHNLSLPLFKTLEAVPHDPNAIGPYPQGAPLG